jgi:hypothetical protein
MASQRAPDATAPAPAPAQAPSPMPAHHRPFGGDRFGILAERFARFFGTPKFTAAVYEGGAAAAPAP